MEQNFTLTLTSEGAGFAATITPEGSPEKTETAWDLSAAQAGMEAVALLVSNTPIERTP